MTALQFIKKRKKLLVSKNNVPNGISNIYALKIRPQTRHCILKKKYIIVSRFCRVLYVFFVSNWRVRSKLCQYNWTYSAHFLLLRLWLTLCYSLLWYGSRSKCRNWFFYLGVLVSALGTSPSDIRSTTLQLVEHWNKQSVNNFRSSRGGLVAELWTVNTYNAK